MNNNDIDPGISNPKFYVISLPGEDRGADLVDGLRKKGHAVRVSDGVHATGQLRAEMVAEEAGMILLRRRLTDPEVGCALAHRNVYMLIRSEPHDSWSIVLEDDAVLVERDLKYIERLAVFFQSTDGPAIVQLYAPADTAVVLRDSTNGGISRTLVPPTTATAYALNRAAAEVLARPAKISHVADWPVEAAGRCGFYILNENAYVPSGAPSTIGDRVGFESRGWQPALRRLAAVSHWRWVRSRDLYGSYRAYLVHEIVRGPVFAYARRVAQSPKHESRRVTVPRALSLLTRKTIAYRPRKRREELGGQT